MRYAPLLALAALVVTGPAAAQTTTDNHAKYQALRARLTTDFVFVGDVPGGSQVAQERNDAIGRIRWADGTIYLGFYLGVLATEYGMLSRPLDFPGFSGSVSATQNELSLALRALERLDEVADAAFPPPCSQSPALNGFFIRDDVPATFHQHFPPLTSVASDYLDPELTNKEMSQDQVHHVLSGLALVKRFVPASVTVQGRSLRAWAIEQATRIGQHVSKNDWVITNPACQRDVARGELASGFSAGTRQVLAFITDGAFAPPTSDQLVSLWNSFRNPASVPYLDEDNVHMAMTIAAAGNGWGDTTAQDLASLTELQDFVLYPLLHRALHDEAASGFCQTAATINARARLMLDELPLGAEPAHPPAGQKAAHGFTSTNRFIRGKASAYVGGPDEPGLRYSGVDYLLLHNLYALATPATWDGGLGAGVPECVPPASDGGVAGDAGPGAAPKADDAGCGCSAPGRSTGGVAWSLIVVALGLGWRRKRRLSGRSPPW